MIQFVYFDLDDTLLDHRHAERQALAALCETYASELGHLPVEQVQAVYHEHNVPLWRRYAQGAIGKDELKRLRFERVLEALAVEGLAAEAVGEHYLELYAQHWTMPEAARAAFHAIADRFPVGILTNGFAAVQRAKLDRFPELRERAAALVISEEVGFLKPHPKLFAHAAEQTGLPPAVLLYVGDSYHSDVEGARGAGWQMAWYTGETAAEAPDVFRFSRWEALTERLLSP